MHLTQRSRVVGVSLAAAAVIGAATAVAFGAGTGPGASGPVTASFAKTSDWISGYQAQYTVSNGTGRTLHGWTVSFDLPAGETISSLWNGAMATAGSHVTVTNPSWAADVDPGRSASFGFVVDVAGGGNAPGGAPGNCLVDGAPCGGGVPAPPTTGGPGPSQPAPPPVSGSSSGAGSKPSTPPASTTPSSAPATGPTSAPAGRGAAYAFAPYVDTAQRQDLGAAARSAGARYVTAAFMLSAGGCSPVWNGSADPAFAANLKAGLADLRAAGGDAVASFGGANGTELAQACPDVAGLKAAYKSVIDEYGFTHVDFDIEGAATGDTASVDRRSQALAQLQSGYAAQGKTLTVSLTLPVLPSGLTQEGLAIVDSAARNGLKIGVVNVMAMDYGDWAAPSPAGKMGTYANQSAQSLHDQLKTVYPDLADAQLWAMVGITPMIGVNDTQDEVFSVADARTVAAFAAQHHIGRVAMWSLTRDQQCPGGAAAWASATCSSVVQAPYAFSNAFEAFTG